MSDAPDFDVNARDRDNAIPRFEMKPIRIADKDGKPQFEDREFVEILVPGDRKTGWYGLVNEEVRTRFPKQYAAWKAGLEAPTEGTPLSECAWLGRAQVEELAFAQVKTVEQLAALTDAQLKATVAMNGYALREKAQRHLEQLAGSAPNEKLAAENATLRANMETMQRQMDDLMERVKATEAQRAQEGAEPPTPAPTPAT